jgi:autotransporter adhesin
MNAFIKPLVSAAALAFSLSSFATTVAAPTDVTYDPAVRGEGPSITLQAEGGRLTTIHNVQAGVLPSDAANVGQVNAVGAAAAAAQTTANGAMTTATAAAAQARDDRIRIDSETSRAETAESGLQKGITAETQRATAAESTIQKSVSTETQRATAAESALGSQITTGNAATLKSANANTASAVASETSRATGVENGLQTQVTADTTTLDSLQQSVSSTRTEVVSASAQSLNLANSYTDQQVAAGVQSANAYTDSRVDALQSSINSYKEDMYAGVASALAVAGLPQPTGPGKSMVSLAGSTYHGATGFAAGYSRVTQDDKWVVKASITTNSRGDFGAVVGAGRQF